ncbi:MAG: hypothetical protein KIT84_31020 [Labilithrix sp.]|nr:hypothetical protein [Labilithrix sp.]MCW5815501.1 hypothetical protein [Labilithrix sp.]
MSSIPPPARDSDAPPKADPGPRRPKYLVVALVMALAFGAGCWTEGCGRLAFYRGEVDYGAQLNQQIKDEQDRERVESLYQRYLDAADSGRGRAIPIAAAIFVLGAALLALTARGLAGKSNTRSALVQVVAAQAIVVAGSYFALKPMREAELEWQSEHTLAMKRETMTTDQFEQVAPMMHKLRRWTPPAWLVFRTFASALILVALTRQRSREFFEAAGGADPQAS